MSYQQPPQGPPPPEYNPGQPGPADHVPQQHGRRRGKRRLMWGIILMAIGLIGGIAGALIFGVSAFDQFDDFEDNTYEIQQPATMDGLGDNQWYIYQTGAAAGSITCEVIDESGENIVSNHMSSSINTNELDYEAVEAFSSEADGVYQISCSNYPVSIGGIAPLGGLFGVVGSVIAGALVFLAGLVLTIVGAVVRSRSKRQMPPQGPQYGGGYPGYGGPPQQYGQQPPQA